MKGKRLTSRKLQKTKHSYMKDSEAGVEIKTRGKAGNRERNASSCIFGPQQWRVSLSTHILMPRRLARQSAFNPKYLSQASNHVERVRQNKRCFLPSWSHRSSTPYLEGSNTRPCLELSNKRLPQDGVLVRNNFHLIFIAWKSYTNSIA